MGTWTIITMNNGIGIDHFIHKIRIGTINCTILSQSILCSMTIFGVFCLVFNESVFIYLFI